MSNWERASRAAELRGKARQTASGVAPGVQGSVYLIRNTATGSIKIGFTTQPIEQRMRKLQQGSEARLELLGSLRCDASHERRLHEACRAQRLSGEWFTNDGEVSRVVSAFALAKRLEAFAVD